MLTAVARSLQKNKEGFLIILYDDIDRRAGAAATAFVEKDFGNVFVLTGGECAENKWLRRFDMYLI